MVEKYIGIENELTSFKGGKLFDFNTVYSKFSNRSGKYVRNGYAKTSYGAHYMDGNVLEINTAPVLINKGFSSRLTDLLMFARSEVAEFSKSIRFTGYSMHWNIDYWGKFSLDNYFAGLAVPFRMFGTTPVSEGQAIRDSWGTVIEIIGDSINNPEQINALALLLGSYSIKAEDTLPIGAYLDKQRFGSLKRRDTIISRKEGNYSAQQYLEDFYDWLKPLISVLGTRKEIRNLEDFIFEGKKLDFDKRGYFRDLKLAGGKKKGFYFPIDIPGSVEAGRALEPLGTNKPNLPIEGQLFKSILRRKRRIRKWGWDFLEMEALLGKEKDTSESIWEIYDYASSVDKSVPKLKRIGRFR